MAQRRSPQGGRRGCAQSAHFEALRRASEIRVARGNQEPNDTPSALLKLLICRILSVSAQVRSMQKSAECAVHLGNPVGGKRQREIGDEFLLALRRVLAAARQAPPFRRRGNSRLVVRSSTLGRIARRAHGRNVFVIARTRRSS